MTWFADKKIILAIGKYRISELEICEYGIGDHGIGEYWIGEHGIGEHGILEEQCDVRRTRKLSSEYGYLNANIGCRGIRK